MGKLFAQLIVILEVFQQILIVWLICFQNYIFFFSLIGLTETKIKVDQSPITNTDLPGYSFISQTSNLNAGVLAFIYPIIWFSISCQILQKVLMILKPFGLKYKILATPICSVVYSIGTQMGIRKISQNILVRQLIKSTAVVKIWKRIKLIIHFKTTTSLSLIKIVDTNNEFSDPKHISDAFNNYFANVGIKLEKEIPRVNKRPEEYLRLPQSNSFFISQTITTEIENTISSLTSGKAVGPFSIPIDILKLLKSVISKPLEILFNTSFSTGTVPTDFKLANIIPVYKKGSRTCLSNYRPISLLSVVTFGISGGVFPPLGG